MIMKKYVKPNVEEIAISDDIAAAVDNPCGGSEWIVSGRPNVDYKVCVHFPYKVEIGSGRNKTYKYVYSSMGATWGEWDTAVSEGGTKVITLKGEHIVKFLDDTTVECYPSSGITEHFPSDATMGCGWKTYTTTSNGDCHFFGIVTVDGGNVTK